MYYKTKDWETTWIIVNYMLIKMIPSKQLSGLHCHFIGYAFTAQHLTRVSSLRRRIGEFVPNPRDTIMPDLFNSRVIE